MKINHKQIVPLAITLILGGALGFWGGSEYGSSRSAGPQNMRFNFQGGGGFAGSLDGPGGSRARGGAALSGGFMAGEILSQDEESITIKLRDEGSRIVFFSASTPVFKTVAGTVSDLAIGGQVMITGRANPDGSMTAESIQIGGGPRQPGR